MRSRWSIAIALLMVVALGATACGDDDDGGGGGGGAGATTPSSTTTLAPQTGGTLTFAAYSAIPGLDPLVALGSGTSGGIQMAAVYDTILRYNVEKKTYEMNMAESLTANADSTEWTLKVKSGIKFSDGTDFNAEAVRFGLQRHRSGLAGGPTAANCAEYIACPRSTRSSGAYMVLVKDLQVVDPLTLKITLTTSWPSFPYALAAEPGMIPSPTAMKKCDGTKNPNTCDFNLKPVGAGPFIVSSFIPNESINYVRNPTYFGGQVYLDGLKFVAFGDLGGDKSYEAFKSGGVNAAYLRVAATVAKANDEKVTGFHNIDQAGETMLMNSGVSVTCAAGKPEPLCTGKPDGATPTNPATRNAKVRQAIYAAYDPNGFNQRVYNGKGLVGTELFQKSFPWDPGVAGPKYDLDAAKKLVAEAKAAGWDGTVRVLFTNSSLDASAGLALESMLKAAGMNPVVDTSKDSVGEQAVVTVQKDYDMARWGTAIGPDDSAIWAVAQNFTATSTANYSGFKSDRAEQAIKDLIAAKTDDQKKVAYKVIAEEYTAQLPWITYSAVETIVAFSPKVHGVTRSHRNFVFFDKAWMEK
ncbi:MAG TPA: ABC transporter substrate-binding protein [Acidimicrobiales bacterium]|jgi:peptide/nickel transport system substrate-binding protein|nr:ABC transporter substrate-binding protein [Acidimicrobiales bacterium]